MGIPTLYSVTNMPKERFSRKWLGLQQRRYRLMYNSFDCMIANNIPIRDALRGMGVSTRIEVIPNGVDLARFSPRKNDPKAAAIRSQWGIGAGELLVTTVGAVMPRKGSDALLEAWTLLSRQNPGAHLALVGPRYDLEQPDLSEFAGRLQKSVLESRTPSNIHFAGLVEDVEDYVRASDIFVLPSEREGMPNSVMEAMACRVPVVITPFAGLSKDLGEPGEQYLLSPRDPEALASTIARLMGDADLRRTLATRGWEWVKANLDLETALRRYAALYRDLGSTGSSG
jgi:glycosyltransferase involved in cell wall biosynthesis